MQRAMCCAVEPSVCMPWFLRGFGLLKASHTEPVNTSDRTPLATAAGTATFTSPGDG